MKKRKAHGTAAAVATTTTQHVVDPYNSNVIDYHPLFNENNNINNNNATSETTTTIVGGGPNNGNATIPTTTTTTTDPMMRAIMIQNHELRTQNIELVLIMKKQHGFIQFEVQQMKQMMYQFVGGDDTYTALHQQHESDDDDESHYSSDDDDDNGSHHSNITVIDYNTTPYEATLSKRPKDLFQLWREYQYGLDGRKAAKKFNKRERGKVKYVYYRRKIIWDKIKEMKTTNGGRYKTSHLAIIELYRKYGKYSTIIDIVNQLRIERRNKTSSEITVGTTQQQTAAGGGPQIQQEEQPSVRANDDDDDESHHNEATLSEKPKDLFQLWIEYQYGIDGRKAAKRFTTSERGKVRYKYHRRKVFWDKIKEMKRGGQYKTSYEAIQELYRIYGGNNGNKKQTNVTNIINQMRKDRRNKKLPPLSAAEASQQTTIGVDEPQMQQQQQQQQPVRADDDDESHSSYDTINDDDTIPYEATLSELPKDLYQLWEEYEYGIGGRKPAKLFNSRERGKVKYKYYRRKVVWDKIQEIMSNNSEEEMTHEEAIEEIYRIYGQKTVSDITNLMRKDRIDQKKKASSKSKETTAAVDVAI